MLIGVTVLLAVAIPGVYAADSYALGTETFTTTQQPTLLTQCSGICMQVTYMNNLNFEDTGFVFAVIHNSLGQTVSIQTAVITPAAGQNDTAFLVLNNYISFGSYNATVFVVSTGGVAISTASAIGFAFY